MSLMAKINNEIELLTNEQFPLEREYKYYDSFANAMNAEKDLSCFSDMDLMFVLFVMNRKSKTFEEMFEGFKPVFEFCTSPAKDERFLLLLDIIENLTDYIELDQMINFTENFNTKEIVINANVDEELSLLKGMDLKIKITTLLVEYKKFGLEVFKNKTALKKIIEMYYAYDGMLNNDYCAIASYKESYEDIQFMKSSYFKRHVQPYYDYVETYDGDRLSIEEVMEKADASQILKKFSEKHFAICKKRENYSKNKNKKIKLYKEVIKILEQMNLEPKKIVNLDDNFYNKLEPEICCELLTLVLEHNRKIFNELQLKNIKNDRYNKVEKLFIQYNYPINELNENEKNILLKFANPAEIEIILQYLTKEKWSWLNVNNPNFVQILINSNKEIFYLVNYYLEADVISKQFVQDNIGILIEENKVKVNEFDIEPLFNTFKCNIEQLKRIIPKVDRRMLKNNYLLIMPTKQLKETIALAKKYQLNIKSDNAKQYSLEILNHTEIFDYLDSIIELGYANYIKENCQILKNNASEVVTRLSIMTNIGLDPMSKEDRLLGSITNGKNFYVGTSSLKQYSLLKVEEYVKNPYFEILKNNERTTVSKKTESLEIISLLDDTFKTSELEYVINDTVISRIKFLRNLECLLNYNEIDNDMIFAALTFNSVLDESTTICIKNILENPNGEIGKKKVML